MSSKFFLGDIVKFKNGKTFVEGKVIDLEWFPLTKLFVYTIEAKDNTQYRVGEPAVKMVPYLKRQHKW